LADAAALASRRHAPKHSRPRDGSGGTPFSILRRRASTTAAGGPPRLARRSPTWRGGAGGAIPRGRRAPGASELLCRATVLGGKQGWVELDFARLDRSNKRGRGDRSRPIHRRNAQRCKPLTSRGA
jgi:hypothetical protein